MPNNELHLEIDSFRRDGTGPSTACLLFRCHCSVTMRDQVEVRVGLGRNRDLPFIIRITIQIEWRIYSRKQHPSRIQEGPLGTSAHAIYKCDTHHSSNNRVQVSEKEYRTLIPM